MNKLTKLSRFLSYVLRHKPEALGLEMTSEGWVSVDELIVKMNEDGKSITFATLKEVVLTDDKQRYALNEDETKIRANQGHSLDIDLNLQAVFPPEHLYHGTATRNLNSIRLQGLLKRNRHHVHLSENQDTAKRVGVRYGEPVILTILAKEMNHAGHCFYCSANGVWLTDTVPVEFIVFPVG